MLRKIFRRVSPRQRRTPGLVTVTIEADTSAFLDACQRAADTVADIRSEASYRRAIAHERSLGLAYVGVQLDQLCRDLGLDPKEAWRGPRAREQRMARHRRELAIQAYWAPLPPRPMFGGICGA